MSEPIASMDEVLAMLGMKEVQLQKTQWALMKAEKKIEELTPKEEKKPD